MTASMRGQYLYLIRVGPLILLPARARRDILLVLRDLVGVAGSGHVLMTLRRWADRSGCQLL
jgi:hypothetical protein